MGYEEGLRENEHFADKDEARRRLLQTRHGALLGTLAYMSPERAQGLVHRLNARSDIYSASVVMHELLTLEHYLGTDYLSLMSMFHAVMHKEPTLTTSRAPGSSLQEALPAEWVYFLTKGMPRCRWRSSPKQAPCDIQMRGDHTRTISTWLDIVRQITRSISM
jgi:serine/threonine protein kinase